MKHLKFYILISVYRNSLSFSNQVNEYLHQKFSEISNQDYPLLRITQVGLLYYNWPTFSIPSKPIINVNIRIY